MGSDLDWLTLIGLLLATYLAWLGIVAAKFKSLELRPSELVFLPRQAHRTRRDLERVQTMARWLAVLPSVAVAGLLPKIVTMILRVDWQAPSIVSISVVLAYAFLAACAIVGWSRVVAIRRRLAGLRAAGR